MKLTTITIIKDILGISFIVWVLINPNINDWWTVLGIAILFGNYNELNK